MSATPAELAAKYERIALCLQGGGALGAYQAGVYQALDEAGVRPTWVAGISIGAINAAIIAGNEPGVRVARLREFWETVSRGGLPFEAPVFEPHPQGHRSLHASAEPAAADPRA